MTHANTLTWVRQNILPSSFMFVKHTCFEAFIFNIMTNSSVTVEAGFILAGFESWLKAGWPRFSGCKFRKHSVD